MEKDRYKCSYQQCEMTSKDLEEVSFHIKYEHMCYLCPCLGCQRVIQRRSRDAGATLNVDYTFEGEARTMACLHCSALFGSFVMMRNHVEVAHKKVFVCRQCPTIQYFGSIDVLRQHFNRCHNNNPYVKAKAIAEQAALQQATTSASSTVTQAIAPHVVVSHPGPYHRLPHCPLRPNFSPLTSVPRRYPNILPRPPTAATISASRPANVQENIRHSASYIPTRNPPHSSTTLSKPPTPTQAESVPNTQLPTFVPVAGLHRLPLQLVPTYHHNFAATSPAQLLKPRELRFTRSDDVRLPLKKRIKTTPAETAHLTSSQIPPPLCKSTDDCPPNTVIAVD